MGIAVEAQKVHRAWSSNDNPETVTVALVLETDVGEEILTVLLSAIDEVNEVAESREDWFDDSGAPPGADAPLARGNAATFRLYCRWGSDPRQWLTELADRLERAGVSGVLTTWKPPSEPKSTLGKLPDGIPAHRVSVVVVPSGLQVPPGQYASEAPWRTAPGRVDEFVDLALEVIDRVDGQVWIQDEELIPAERSDVPQMLRAALLANPFQVPDAWVARTGPRSSWGMVFDSRGRVHIVVDTDDASIESAAVQASEIAETWAGWCDWQVLVEGGRYANFASTYNVIRQSELARPFKKRNDRNHEVLPDVFARMVVTGAHLAAAEDLTGWEITKIAEDRYRVIAPDWQRFLHPASSLAPTRAVSRREYEPPNWLSAARTAWGNALLLR